MTANPADVAAIEADRALASGREDANRALRSDVRAELTAIRASRDAIKLAVLDAARADINADPAPFIKDVARALIDTDRALVAVAKLLTD